MSQALRTAHLRAWNLANALMVCIIVFQAGNGDYGVMPTNGYDGDPAAIVDHLIRSDNFRPGIQPSEASTKAVKGLGLKLSRSAA